MLDKAHGLTGFTRSGKLARLNLNWGEPHRIRLDWPIWHEPEGTDLYFRPDLVDSSRINDLVSAHFLPIFFTWPNPKSSQVEPFSPSQADCPSHEQAQWAVRMVARSEHAWDSQSDAKCPRARASLEDSSNFHFMYFDLHWKMNLLV